MPAEDFVVPTPPPLAPLGEIYSRTWEAGLHIGGVDVITFNLGVVRISRAGAGFPSDQRFPVVWDERFGWVADRGHVDDALALLRDH